MRRDEPIDPAALAEVTGGDRDLERRIFEQFALMCGEDAGQIGRAASLGERALVAGAAHRLRGAAGTLGAADLAEACLRLERAALAGDASAMEPAIVDIEAQLRRVIDYISKAGDET